MILTPDCPGGAGPFIVQLQFAGQGEWREATERKPVGRCFQRTRRQIQKQRGLQWAMHNKSGIGFGFGGVDVIIVNAMGIERQRRIAKQKNRIRCQRRSKRVGVTRVSCALARAGVEISR